nr:MAG: DNA pilot protein [Microvirus sp.]
MLGLIGQALGSVVGSVGNYFAQQETNRTNVDMANNQMNFQQAMDKTKHQREVADLKAAGLNPTLSAGGSPGVPSGASATLQAPQIAMPDLLAYGVSLKQMEIKEKELQNSTALTAAQIANTTSDTDLKKAQKILAQKGLIRANMEGEASTLIQDALRAIKKSVRNPAQPGKMYPENLTPPMP